MTFKSKKSITHGNTNRIPKKGHRPVCPNERATNDIPKPHTSNTNYMKSRSTTKTPYVRNKT